MTISPTTQDVKKQKKKYSMLYCVYLSFSYRELGCETCSTLCVGSELPLQDGDTSTLRISRQKKRERNRHQQQQTHSSGACSIWQQCTNRSRAKTDISCCYGDTFQLMKSTFQRSLPSVYSFVPSRGSTHTTSCDSHKHIQADLYLCYCYYND